MKVFKFGGASVRDAEGVRNLARVVKPYALDDLVIIVSAMGKTTNALEAIVWSYCDGRDTKAMFEALRRDHLAVLAEVAPEDIAAAAELVLNFDSLRTLLEKPTVGNVDRDYDGIVAFGEVWSTLIVSAHLKAMGIGNAWVDARTIIRTDEQYRRAGVDWSTSERRASTLLSEVEGTPKRIVTQGFIGASSEGTTTTLGREGSDFSAAIFAYLLDAESVTIWKDVPGMFNADPNRFPDTKLLGHISYREAIELSYFGASVIHPRTLQPLQKKQIPLYVRSFKDMAAPGSVIDAHSENDSLIPSFIIKSKQLLISITPRDLSFIVEENLSDIFKLFAKRNVRIDLMQNSAVAFSVVVDDSPRSRELIDALGQAYEVRYNESCELITVRHYDEATLVRLTANREVLVEQRSRSTARFVVH
ncbi:MAG: aspartate kinase [Flavobacteriales bacterium]|nr:aspartate kinase [Flavobacteriales bacterium]MBK6884812.1 aspartate kinase [Flavobacteriales bacterium]MBK7102134.1 aspartate kinase [Flavobacteriales bacterium]MBK7112604.1 aspartate kinase [Flavobacteriales bacterium]MBK7483442.1 aspartate kinase [Flavobacteriales bacterium]